VGETHGRMKDERATLKGLNINTLKVQPFQGCNFYFISFPPVSPVAIQIQSGSCRTIFDFPIFRGKFNI
jgi:hypothetical protein